jgi:predicted 3-demethylubiquinone-9 3-methyltransferase (glyoxalase superfamily)
MGVDCEKRCAAKGFGRRKNRWGCRKDTGPFVVTGNTHANRREFMPKITPFLWFDNNLDEALALYLSIFKQAKVTYQQRGPDGETFSAGFELEGQAFMGLNGGPYYQFTPAVSFFVACADQAEVDHYWNSLLDGGTAQQCGWLTDRFGVTWQIIPNALMQLMSDPAKAGRVQAAMMKMVKIDVAGLEKAAAG